MDDIAYSRAHECLYCTEGGRGNVEGMWKVGGDGRPAISTY